MLIFVCVCVRVFAYVCLCVTGLQKPTDFGHLETRIDNLSRHFNDWTGPGTCRYDNGFGSHIEDGPCELHDLSGSHSRSQPKGDSASTDEDEAFKEQNDIEDPFQPNAVRSI